LGSSNRGVKILAFSLILRSLTVSSSLGVDS